jgi:hypothetical protein
MLETSPGIAACLMEGVPVEREDRIALTFPVEKEFQLQRLRADLGLIDDESRKHLGRKMMLELVDGDHQARTEHREGLRREVAPTENEALANERRTDPALDSLVEMIDGEAVPDSEREEWLRRPDGGTGS